MTRETTVRWTGGMQFVGVSGSGHAVVMDTSPEHGGTSSAPTPMEMLITALAGCTGMDVVSLLKKMRVDFTRLEIKVRGERREEHPRIFTRIELEYTVYGNDIDESAVKRAIDLSQEKYCSVTGMLRPACPINYRYQIVSQ
ncbi:MAG: OsmC family protein [bacterium]